jgi:hypothetical protein
MSKQFHHQHDWKKYLVTLDDSGEIIGLAVEVNARGRGPTDRRLWALSSGKPMPPIVKAVTTSRGYCDAVARACDWTKDTPAAPAARVAVVVEVVAVGFDGSTDKTDDRVLWVGAPSVEIVAEMLNALNVPHESISATDLDPAKVEKPEVLDYEHDAAELVAALYRFALADAGAALDTAESFMSGFEGDEMQEGMPAMLEQVRHARFTANRAARNPATI